MASSLRSNAAKAGITGTVGRCHAGRRMRSVQRFTARQVAALAAIYRPRRPDYRDVAARLRLAA
ncbi:MAG: hypothetical protein ACTH0H_05720 [Brachybacterium sp.]